MNYLKTCLCLVLVFAWSSINAQVLEVPTLESKGISGKVSQIVWHQHQFVNEKGLVYVKKDVETYDDKGRLASVLTENFNNKQSYKTQYTLNKKGQLELMQIVNPTNNLALQTTAYEYKKGLLVKTTQTQGPNSVVKNYSYNKAGGLVQVEVFQNGTKSLTETYELDDQDRRLKVSRLLPGQTEVKVTSTFTYEEKDGNRITVEKRLTDQGEFEITKVTNIATNRDISENTKRMSDGVEGANRQVFENDESGNWVKGEVIDDQFSRPRLVLRKLTYADGTVTGRDDLLFPNDYRGQYFRKYSNKQVVVNGRIYAATTALSLDYTSDRLSWIADLNAWVVMKEYDDNTNMTKWAEARVIEGDRNTVLWAASNTGIHVFNAGRKMVSGTGRNSVSSYEIGGSVAAYVRADINKSFTAIHPAKSAGQVMVAELNTDHFHWGKASDSTYVLVNRGRSVNLQKQVEDTQGNKLAMMKQGSVYYWYLLPEFRKRFDESDEGVLHKARPLYEPLKAIQEEKVLALDFSKFSYDKLANKRYRLRSADGTSVTSIASGSLKTPDDELIAYFPLTQQYLRMKDYYKLEDGKEWPGQSVEVMTDSSAYAYYLYKEGKSIVFYKPEGRISKRVFGSHKLSADKKRYGGVVYDSLDNISYGMTYDLEGVSAPQMGRMHKLPANSQGAYLLKLEGGRWVVFVKGHKEQDYSFSKLRENQEVVHFYKDTQGKTRAHVFRSFDEKKPGEFIYAYNATQKEVSDLLTELGIDPGLKKSEIDSAPPKKPGTFDVEGGAFFLRDASGKYIQNDLAWFGNYGAGQDLIAYDSVSGITYRLKDYYAQEQVSEAPAEILINNNEVGAWKMGVSNIFISNNGVYKRDVGRAFVTQNGSDKTWKEVLYDRSVQRSFLLTYPSDSGFYSIETEPLPPSHDHAYVFRVTEKNFVMIVEGKLVRDKTIRSRNYEGDLIRRIPVEGKIKGYRFRGFQSAAMQQLIVAEEIDDQDFERIWNAAGEALKKNDN